MILATRTGNHEVRSSGMFAGVDVIPIPALGVGSNGQWSVVGKRITPSTAIGLPPLLRGLRLLVETGASMPLTTIKENPDGTKVKEIQAWQWQLLHNQPNDTSKTAFNFKAFVFMSMIAWGNAYILKAKARGQVQLLYPLQPKKVQPKYKKDGLTLEYHVMDAKGKVHEYDSEDIIHIPGMLTEDPCIGVSPITLAANGVGTALGTEEYAGRTYANDAEPGGILEFPGGADSRAAKDTRETWEDRHRSARNARKVAALFGGATYKQVGVSAQDAQLIEAQQWGLTVCANVLGVPVWAVGGADQNPRSTPEQRNSELLTFSLLSWLIRFEQGLHADEDLFPDKELSPAFETDGIARAEMYPRYQSYVLGRQAGWLSANDIRRRENEPPIPGGDVYQTTPVGGEGNKQPDGKDSPDDDDDDKSTDGGTT